MKTIDRKIFKQLIEICDLNLHPIDKFDLKWTTDQCELIIEEHSMIIKYRYKYDITYHTPERYLSPEETVYKLHLDILDIEFYKKGNIIDIDLSLYKEGVLSLCEGNLY